jgi:hypothetical protein
VAAPEGAHHDRRDPAKPSGPPEMVEMRSIRTPPPDVPEEEIEPARKEDRRA